MAVKATAVGNLAHRMVNEVSASPNDRTLSIALARPKSTPTQMYKQKMAELHEKLDATEQGFAEGTVDLEDFDSTDEE